MKKVILSSVLAVAAIGSISTAANAASTAMEFCSGASGNGATADISSSATSFIKVAFVPKCSSNTFVYGSDSDTFYRVGSGSAKGKTKFAGSTMGGGVVAAGSCAVTGCVSTDASGAIASTFAPTS